MRLFIAEKPSVGRELSKVLSKGKGIDRRDGYIVQGDDVITWAFGHMLQQAEPGEYDDAYKYWNAHDLPIVPESWKLLITKSSEKQFHTICGLIEKADVIVNAGDPDREGQLLIDEILTYVKTEKPVQRILLNALDEKSIREALDNLQDNKKFYNLQQSALARARADWLIGMNLSRAYTLKHRRKEGGRTTFPVGRVKTPTLALIVRRERELADFKPVDYHVLKVKYAHPNGEFWATWEPMDTQKGLDSEGRLIDRTYAEKLSEALLEHRKGIIEDRKKAKKKESPRLPLSLSTLQVLAGKLFHYDPQQVLQIAQKLYEKKFTTYPRSDCEYLPMNQWKDATAILNNLKGFDGAQISSWAEGANPKLKSRAWNDKKITAHHAIIPTTVKVQAHQLTESERNIYFLIAQAYMAQFYGDHEYEQTKITVLQLEERFTVSGRVVIEEGWKSLYKREKKKKEDTDSDEEEQEESNSASELPVVKKGDLVESIDTSIDKRSTKPPPRFTSATLIQAMKEIHKYVKEDELKKQLKDVSGIGTEATRATIISELVGKGFMEEKGKKKLLYPTESAYRLIDLLPEEMLYPDETAIWEERLALMSEGKDTLESFINDQVAFLQRLIEKANEDAGAPRTRGASPKGISGEKKALEPTGEICPDCKEGELQIRSGKYGQFKGCSRYPDCKYTENMEGHSKEERVIEAKDTRYKCPRCESGYFQLIGNTWRCSSHPKCRTSCADVDGKPSIC